MTMTGCVTEIEQNDSVLPWAVREYYYRRRKKLEGFQQL